MKDILQKPVEEQDAKALCYAMFKVELTPKQEEIVHAIGFQKSKRIVISAYTRYGKSFCVALGVCLYIAFNKDKKVNIIAPLDSQTAILRNYISEFILASKEMTEILDLEMTGPERLKREVSRKRITFKNGCQLRVFSAEGQANRLMGWGADCLICDEDCLIDYEVYRQKISRMLGDSPDSCLVSIGNPWHRDGQMYSHWTDPSYLKIHIGYQDGIEEGRVDETFIEDQREILTPFEFTVLYEAEFPEESEDQLIRYKWIQKALTKDMKITQARKIVGVDVAEFGLDWTVVTYGITDENNYKITEVKAWSKKDTMETVGLLLPSIDESMEINVDANGVGSGVQARLKELEYKANRIMVGEGATNEEDKARFSNKKAEYYMHLRKLFEEGRIQIPNERKLINELLKIKYKLTSSRKIVIIDPEDKSPDYADSLMLACVPVKTKTQYWID